jgi:hypothetical protein
VLLAAFSPEERGVVMARKSTKWYMTKCIEAGWRDEARDGQLEKRKPDLAWPPRPARGHVRGAAPRPDHGRDGRSLPPAKVREQRLSCSPGAARPSRGDPAAPIATTPGVSVEYLVEQDVWRLAGEPLTRSGERAPIDQD